MAGTIAVSTQRCLDAFGGMGAGSTWNLPTQVREWTPGQTSSGSFLTALGDRERRPRDRDPGSRGTA